MLNNGGGGKEARRLLGPGGFLLYHCSRGLQEATADRSPHRLLGTPEVQRGPHSSPPHWPQTLHLLTTIPLPLHVPWPSLPLSKSGRNRNPLSGPGCFHSPPRVPSGRHRCPLFPKEGEGKADTYLSGADFLYSHHDSPRLWWGLDLTSRSSDLCHSLHPQRTGEAQRETGNRGVGGANEVE